MKKLWLLLPILSLSITVLAQTKRNCDSTFKETDGVTVYFCADKPAQYPGGDVAYQKFIRKNMRYPVMAADANTHGDIIVQVVINEKGKVTQPQIIKRLEGPGAKDCATEALRLMSILPDFIPAYRKGKAVRLAMDVNVHFGVGDEENTKIELSDSLPPGDYPPQPALSNINYGTTNNWLAYKPMDDTGKVYSYADQIPGFPGGNSAMINYIVDNITYPKSATRGTVFIYFIVEKDGSLSNLKVAGSIDGPDSNLFDTEALRIVSGMPKWIPGKDKGNVVRMEYNLPIRFR